MKRLGCLAHQQTETRTSRDDSMVCKIEIDHLSQSMNGGREWSGSQGGARRVSVSAGLRNLNRSYLINRSRWRGERFWLATRRDTGRILAAALTEEQRRGQPKDPPLLLLLSSPIFMKNSDQNAAAGIYEMASWGPRRVSTRKNVLAKPGATLFYTAKSTTRRLILGKARECSSLCPCRVTRQVGLT